MKKMSSDLHVSVGSADLHVAARRLLQGWQPTLRRVEHKLLDILVIAVCAVIGEAESFEDIALYGRCKRDWLQRFLELPNGIPSHDTFRRVLMLVDPDAFERCFLGWVRAVFRPQ